MRIKMLASIGGFPEGEIVLVPYLKGERYIANGWAKEVPEPGLSAPQPPPTPNEHPAVWNLVRADMTARDAEGRRKYGVPLQPHNGRDALVDAYQETLDLIVYLRQAIFERDGR